MDEFLYFRSLNRKDIKEIVKLFIDRVHERMEGKSMDLEVDDEVIEMIAREGFDPANGARPVRRLVQKHIEDPLSEKMLLNKYAEGDLLKVTLEDKEISVEVLPRQAPDKVKMDG